jgi:2-keto-4-pentenoate hydratase
MLVALGSLAFDRLILPRFLPPVCAGTKTPRLVTTKLRPRPATWRASQRGREEQMIMAAIATVGDAARLAATARHDLACQIFHRHDTLRPDNLAQAYAIQQSVCQSLGAFGGWEICHPPFGPTVACAPLPLASIHPAGLPVPKHDAELIDLAVDICFRLGRSLPDYDAPYTRHHVRAAIESCHPGLTVLQRPPRDPGLIDPLADIAESCSHRLLVTGEPVANWSPAETGRVAVEVRQRRERIFSGDLGLADDPIDALQWLANHGARWDGGLMVGQWVAIRLGSKEISIRTGQPAHITLGALGSIDLRFI